MTLFIGCIAFVMFVVVGIKNWNTAWTGFCCFLVAAVGLYVILSSFV